MLKKNGYLKILIGCVWGMDVLVRRVGCIQSLLTLQMGTLTFDFQSNELLQKFLEQIFL